MESYFPKITHFEKGILINALVTYNIGNRSKESEKYNKCLCHLAYEIRGEQNSQFVLIFFRFIICLKALYTMNK